MFEESSNPSAWSSRSFPIAAWGRPEGDKPVISIIFGRCVTAAGKADMTQMSPFSFVIRGPQHMHSIKPFPGQPSETPALKGYCGSLADNLRPRVHDSLSDSTPICPSGVLANRLYLTRRQAEVLHWVAEGKTNTEISTILGCSFFTVKNHIKEIFQRLGVHSRTAAAAAAYRVHINGMNGAAQNVTAAPAPATRKRVRKDDLPASARPNGSV